VKELNGGVDVFYHDAGVVHTLETVMMFPWRLTFTMRGGPLAARPLIVGFRHRRSDRRRGEPSQAALSSLAHEK